MQCEHRSMLELDVEDPNIEPEIIETENFYTVTIPFCKKVMEEIKKQAPGEGKLNVNQTLYMTAYNALAHKILEQTKTERDFFQYSLLLHKVAVEATEHMLASMIVKNETIN